MSDTDPKRSKEAKRRIRHRKDLNRGRHKSDKAMEN